MKRLGIRLRDKDDGQFVADANPKPGEGVRTVYVETPEKKGDKKK